MLTSTELALGGFAILLLTGLFSDKLSDRNGRFPRLIGLIVGGIILGQIAKISPLSMIIDSISDPNLVLFIAEFALTLVLFKEGLELNLTAFRKSLRSVLILAFGAVILSSFFFAFVITLFTPINFFIALLIAGILAPTDPAATFSMFRGGLRLKPKEKNIIGSESALNDAVAIVIVVELFLSAAETGRFEFSFGIIFAVFTGFFGGIMLGYVMGLIFLKINQNLGHYVQTNYLSFALVGLSFVIPVYLHEIDIVISPAITSLTAGAVFGNPQFFKFPRYSKSHIHEFNNGIAEIGEIVAFGAFGTLFSFVDFWLALGLGLLFTIVTLGSRYLVVVYILRFPSGLTKNESIFIAWGGMRGLATGVLAIIAYQTFLLNDNALGNMGPEVFLTSILTGLILMTIIQGSTLKIVGMKTKSINLSNRKSDLLIERKIIISKLAFYQKERDVQELTINDYKELTIPLRDRLTQIYHELQLEIVSRRERMRSYVKELELFTTVIMDLGIDEDNVVLHEMHQEIKDSEIEIVEKVQTELQLFKLELASSRTRSIDKKNMLEILVETKDQFEELNKKSSSSYIRRIIEQIESIQKQHLEDEEKKRLAREAEEKEILEKEIDRLERLELVTEEKERLEKEVEEAKKVQEEIEIDDPKTTERITQLTDDNGKDDQSMEILPDNVQSLPIVTLDSSPSADVEKTKTKDSQDLKIENPKDK